MDQYVIKRLRHFLYTQKEDAHQKGLPSLALTYEETYKQLKRLVDKEGGVHPLYPERIIEQLTAWLIKQSARSKITMGATTDVSVHSRNYWHQEAYQATLQWIQRGGR